MRESRMLLLCFLGGLAVLIYLLAAHFRHHEDGGRMAGAAAAPAAAEGGKPLYWYDPMFPNQHFDHPGKSPFMDMQLVPRTADQGTVGAASGAGSVSIDPRVVQNLGVRLAAVEQGQFARVVDTVGLVAVDEHRIQAVQVRAPGWVEQLAVRAVGDPVRRGQFLAGVYSPELLAAQQEFLIALGSGDAGLAQAARARLGLFGLTEGQVSHIAKTRQAERRVGYYAPADGYVMELGVRQGAAVQPGTTLFQLADLGTVWINAEAAETQAAWIKAGDRVQAEVPALPGVRFDGQVDYLYPELSAATRTLKLRLVVGNPGQRLRPGMFASVHLLGAPKEAVLMVPTEAVIKTGARSVVIVADDGSHFHPALVQVGAEYAGRSEIIEGLTAGQQVVASGQFLIDSEASLRGAFDNLTGAGAGQGGNVDPQLMPAPAAGER
ncbi:efflux RND transporter periplasmic adaptor subunit [Nevskia soli]|uniref:efflux RND transporter periplasmic adaptor subunit n=1 Tax=Nevskia soli TaxID=418856 RepID=UPI000A06A5B2|nr:efflux RND transporter periplasmic adaptor subunit [Nevskia soli]